MVMTGIPELHMGPFFRTQSNPIHGWIHSMPNSVTCIDDSMESYSQRAVTESSKGTPGNAKCVMEILGGTKIRGQTLSDK